MLAATPAVNRSSPGAVVSALYAWHVHHNVTAYVAEMKPYLTASLYTNLATVVRDQSCLHVAMIDSDPLTGTQVGMPSFRLGTVTVRGNTATVVVDTMAALVSSHPFAGPTVKVLVVRDASGWRISDVIPPPGGGLAAMLRKELVNPTGRLHTTAAERACLKKPIP